MNYFPSIIQGGFHDFVEILKLYDKNEDNTMLAHELFRLLTNLGEKLTKEEAKSLMKELCEPPDDDGFMPFIRKYKKLDILNNDTYIAIFGFEKLNRTKLFKVYCSVV